MGPGSFSITTAYFLDFNDVDRISASIFRFDCDFLLKIAWNNRCQYHRGLLLVTDWLLCLVPENQKQIHSDWNL